MRLLLDTCVWGGVCRELQAQGHDVIWAGECGLEIQEMTKSLNVPTAKGVYWSLLTRISENWSLSAACLTQELSVLSILERASRPLPAYA